MTLNNDFVKAVADVRMWEIYQRLSDIMPIDPSLREQDKMLKYAEQNLLDLYQPHDGEALKTDPVEWTKKYYDDEKYRLEKNFSRERLKLLRDMTKHRYADTINHRSEQEHERQRTQQLRKEQLIEAKHIGGAVALIGVVAAGVGIGVGSTAVSVAGVVVAVGGVTVAVTSTTKK